MPQAQFFSASSTMPISHAVRAGDLVITATLGPHFFRAEDVIYDTEGRVIDDGSGKGHLGIAEQTRATMENVRTALESAGCTLAEIVDMTVWLSSPRDFAAFNAVYAEYFPAGKPTRTVLGTTFMFDCRIEMKALAYKPLGGNRSEADSDR
jgi:enamine deaminase RidA (YjgF/YER057c/UK114 family)